MTMLTNLSLELIDRILFALDPVDVARVSQTSRFFHTIIYGPLSQQFWRGLYLAQPLDDPRCAVTPIGAPRRAGSIKWREELQRIVQARMVMRVACRGDDAGWGCPRRYETRREALRTCIELVSTVPPLLDAEHRGGGDSRNVKWIQHHLGDGAFLERTFWEGKEGEEGETMSGEETQLLGRLHVLCGLTRRDVCLGRRSVSQAFVYSLRNHTAARGYGPFLPDGDGRRRVDWMFTWILVHAFGMLLRDTEDEDSEERGGEGSCAISGPLSAMFGQCVIPKGLNLDKEEDWAGVEGLWSVKYGFMDHREFILYNDPTVPEDGPQDTSIFDGTEETLAAVDIYFSVASTEPDPLHPTRPKINVVGEVDGKFNVVGFIKLTEDNQIWWHFGAGNDDQIVWNCEGIALGGVRSRCGYIGIWSTVFHDAEDPIGPFWMQREILIEEDE